MTLPGVTRFASMPSLLASLTGLVVVSCRDGGSARSSGDGSATDGLGMYGEWLGAGGRCTMSVAAFLDPDREGWDGCRSTLSETYQELCTPSSGAPRSDARFVKSANPCYAEKIGIRLGDTFGGIQCFYDSASGRFAHGSWFTDTLAFCDRTSSEIVTEAAPTACGVAPAEAEKVCPRPDAGP
jgi:hypothetical protein